MKRLALEIYEEVTQSIRIGKTYKTRFDPLSSDPCVAYPKKE